jgi:hypothetical protein
MSRAAYWEELRKPLNDSENDRLKNIHGSFLTLRTKKRGVWYLLLPLQSTKKYAAVQIEPINSIEFFPIIL